MIAFLIFLVAIVFIVESALFNFSVLKAKAVSYKIAKKCQFELKNNEDRFRVFKSEMSVVFYPSISFKYFFLRKDKDFEIFFLNIAPIIENIVMHKESIEIANNEILNIKKIKDSEFLTLTSSLYTACSKICNAQFFEEKNLVSKDQVREIISDMVLEATILKIKGDDLDVNAKEFS